MDRIAMMVPMTPPSVNHYWTGQGKATRLSRAARDWKALVLLAAQGRSLVPVSFPRAQPPAYKVSVTVVFGQGQRGDIDNSGKAVCDALASAGVIHTDDRIMEYHAYKDVAQRPCQGFTQILVELLPWAEQGGKRRSLAGK